MVKILETTEQAHFDGMDDGSVLMYVCNMYQNPPW